MAKLITVSVLIGGDLHNFRIDPTKPVSVVLKSFIEKFDLPDSDQSGNPSFYALAFVNRKPGYRINEAATLSDEDVRDREILTIVGSDNMPVVQVRNSKNIERKTEMFSSELEALNALNRNLVLNTLAQNRTTYAVRALVRFFIMQFASASSAAFLWWYAYQSVDGRSCRVDGDGCGPHTVFILLACLIYLVGFTYSWIQILSEFRASDES